MRTVRNRRGWTQQHLSARLDALGYHLTRGAIAKIELGRSRISLDGALAISAALGVAPVNMFAPMHASDHVLVAPKLTPGSGEVRAWIRGHKPLGDDLLDEDAHLYYTEAPLDEIEALAQQAGRRDPNDPIPVTEHHARKAVEGDA
jgi:transcriptional regulator with XRE-family HTH domain